MDRLECANTLQTNCRPCRPTRITVAVLDRLECANTLQTNCLWSSYCLQLETTCLPPSESSRDVIATLDASRSLASTAASEGSCRGAVGGGDESVRHGAESQWIVAARPLCHLQYPVAYLSRLQRILPAVRSKLIFKAARRGSSAAGASPTARAHGGQRGPY